VGLRFQMVSELVGGQTLSADWGRVKKAAGIPKTAGAGR